MDGYARVVALWRGGRLLQPIINPIAGLFQVNQNILERTIINLDQLDIGERAWRRKAVVLRRGCSKG
jgi:hypothetical protein